MQQNELTKAPVNEYDLNAFLNNSSEAVLVSLKYQVGKRKLNIIPIELKLMMKDTANTL